jgi:hypothetical protein
VTHILYIYGSWGSFILCKILSESDSVVNFKDLTDQATHSLDRNYFYANAIPACAVAKEIYK